MGCSSAAKPRSVAAAQRRQPQARATATMLRRTAAGMTLRHSPGSASSQRRTRAQAGANIFR
eukprot:8966228-Lingulodinium_polyedra.AAC.1